MIQTRYYKTIRVIVDSDGGGTPFYIENVDTVPGYFTLSKSGTPTYTPNLNYRIDNGEWFEYDVVNLPRIEVPVGSKIYLKGNNTDGFSLGYKIVLGYKHNIGGYITSLLALENFNLISHIPNSCFGSVFNGDNKLISAENLITSNITSVGNAAFGYCFSGCTSLVTAPTFENVTSVGEYCFDNCFKDCTSLVTAPTFENVTSVGNSGFRMCFEKCSSLVTAPTFKNVTSVGMYSFHTCFSDCTSLVTSPMFNNVTKYDMYGFVNCFMRCTSLRTIIAPRISPWTTTYFSDWVFGVPTGGTFYKKKGLTIPTGTSGIPEGWTVVEEA